VERFMTKTKVAFLESRFLSSQSD